MIDLTSRQEILRADREATAVAMRGPSILHRIFGSFKREPVAPTFADVVNTFANTGAAPLLAEQPITDNAMVLESILEDLCHRLGLDPIDTVTRGSLAVVLSDILIGDQVSSEYAQLQQWLNAEVLPSNFRRIFVDFIIKYDDLEDLVANLSQARWERLRSWSNGHD